MRVLPLPTLAALLLALLVAAVSGRALQGAAAQDLAWKQPDRAVKNDKPLIGGSGVWPVLTLKEAPT